MEQIYNFEGVRPPVLNEKLLRAEQTRRRQRIYMVLLILGAIYVLACIGLFASAVVRTASVAAVILMIYVAVSVFSGGAFAIYYVRKGEVKI